MKMLRVLHAPTTVGGNPQGLSRAEKKIGLISRTVTFEQNFFQYPADEVVFRRKSRLIDELRRWYFILRALLNYDVFHYNFGTFWGPEKTVEIPGKKPVWLKKIYNLVYGRLFHAIDLKLAKLFRKSIVVTFQGEDARQMDFCLRNFEITHYREVEGTNYRPPISDIAKQKRIQLFDKYADRIYSLNPDLLHVLPARAQFLPYASVDPLTVEPFWVPEDLQAPHIVHAPTSPLFKGTKYVMEALERLKAEGISFRLTLVEKMSNQEARLQYQNADLLIDQLLAGWYGGVAVEAMAMGKPVVCYLRQSDLHLIDQEMRSEIPIIDADPSSIYEVLKLWLTTKKKDLRLRGMQSRAFVEKWHDPLKIARRLKNEYESIHSKK